MRRGFSLVLIMVASFAVLAGCSDDKTEKIAIESTEPASGQAKISAPASVSGGVVTIDFKNSGKAPHEAQLVRVEGAHSRDEVVQSVAGDNNDIPTWLLTEGGVGSTAPGQSRSATVKLAPGRHFVVDTGTDDTGNSFAKSGAVAELMVTGDSGGKVSRSGARIEARDYEFTLPTLKAGTQNITFDNVGNQPHLLFAAPIQPGKTLDDVKTSLTSQDQASGPPPVEFMKGTSVAAVEGTKTIATTLTLEKGNYVFICFLSDRGGGAPHFTLGMLQEAAVS